VFGVWAIVAGVAQLALLLRRRALLGNQWPLVLASVGSGFAGVGYVIASGGADPKLHMIALYAAGGGTEFVVQAWLTARRRRRMANAAAPVLSAS
jgi:uncharacterized membrane protein HdeD (DUF308 family)